MKCIKDIKSGAVTRVPDCIADMRVRVKQDAVYVPKSVWKQEVRDNHAVVPQPHPDMMFNIWATSEKEGTK